MDAQSPPKRVTRARAAKKDQTIKIATASTRAVAAKSEPAGAETTTLLPPKTRRTRASSHLDAEHAIHREQQQEQQEQQRLETNMSDIQKEKPKSKGRSRVKLQTVASLAHIAEEEALQEEEELESLSAAVPMKVTRARAKKGIETTTAAAVAPVRATRGRAAKASTTENIDSTATNPTSKTTRARSTIVQSTTKSAPKKAVQFVVTQNDKENASVPQPEAKPSSTTGIKAKPIRKAAIAAHTVRGKPNPPTPELKSSPLSPKKITQVSPNKFQESEDELAAMHKTPMMSLLKSPVKPPSSIMTAANKLNHATSIQAPSTIVVNRVSIPEQRQLNASVLASPARRLPASPFKGSLKTSPTHAVGNSFLKSPFKPQFSATKSTATSSVPSFKDSLLQSPARRAPSPLKGDAFGSPFKMSSSPFKTSLMQSPAKRSLSPIKGRTSPTRPAVSSSFASTPKATTFHVSRFTTPRTLNKKAFRPGRIMSDDINRPATEVKSSNENIKPFSGRLSSILPRKLDSVCTRDDDGIAIQARSSELVMQDESDGVEVSTSKMQDEDSVENIHQANEADEAEDANISDTDASLAATTPRQITGTFEYRSPQATTWVHTDESDSEDELASGHANPQTPVRSTKFTVRNPSIVPQTPMTNTVGKSSQKIGFTPLAQQLNAWVAHSPNKQSILQGHSALPLANEIEQLNSSVSPPPNSMFQEEMEIREDEILEQELLDAEIDSLENGEVNTQAVNDTSQLDVEVDAMTFAPQLLDDQDLELAVEAEEMSLLDFTAGEANTAAPPDIDMSQDDSGNVNVVDEVSLYDDNDMVLADADCTVLDTSAHDEIRIDLICDEDQDSAMSEASQEYGDENLVPADLSKHLPSTEMNLVAEQDAGEQNQHQLAESTPRPVRKHARISYSTPLPRHSTPRVVHTTSKVPLKPAAAESPLKLQARSFTAARPTTKRPASVALTSTRSTPRRSSSVTPQTPVTTETPETPSAVPQQQESSVLEGAVVYVDVHTVEGADASAVFIELLTSMGARCVKSWSWNPSSQTSSPEDSSTKNTMSKVGITHVVFKDGGKRTIEKVRESAGAVACVGVGWVLDCERSNGWVSEAPYEIDTSLVPRGGHRRRKSMEPRTLQNLNTSGEPSVAQTPRAVSHSAVESANRRSSGTSGKFNRRKSTAWVRSPASDSMSSHSSPSNGGLDAFAEETLVLSPAPQTPDEAEIMRRVEACLDGQGEPTPYNKKQVLLQQTVPVQKHTDMKGDALVEVNQDRGALMQRLMLARRKSLQWAPKVGSPLSRTRAFSP